jgi:hypothetical protein
MSKRAAAFKSDEKKKKAKTYHISKVSNVITTKIKIFHVSYSPYGLPRRNHHGREDSASKLMLLE